VLRNALTRLRHLDHGLGIILAFIGLKLVRHWAHTVWSWIPDVPTQLSLVVILAVLATVTITSVLANRREEKAAEPERVGV